MNILVTGANGFIGSHLVRKLLNDHKIIALKRASSSLKRLEDVADKITWYEGESLSQLQDVFNKEKIDLILHLATKYVKLHTKTEEVLSMNESNINFPSLLADLASQHNVRYFINTGTCFAYEMSDKPINETTLNHAINYYAATKLAFEHILKYFTETSQMKVVTLKLFYPYGEADNVKLMQVLFRAQIKKTPINMTKGEQQLSFTYVSDIVDAYVATINYIQSNDAPKFDVFNIGNEQVTSVKEIVEKIEAITGSTGYVKIGAQPYSANEVMYMQCDSGKAKRVLGWSTKISVEESLKKMYEYYKLSDHL